MLSEPCAGVTKEAQGELERPCTVIVGTDSSAGIPFVAGPEVEEVEISGASVMLAALILEMRSPPKMALAVDAALSAAVTVLKGGGLDVRRQSDWRVEIEGDGERLLERDSELRWVLRESRPVGCWLGEGDGEGERVEAAGDDEGCDDLETWREDLPSIIDGPEASEADSACLLASSASFFFFSSASFR